MAKSGKTIQKVDTVVNADSVEWCPYHDNQHILLCGTYKLQESQSSLLEAESEPPSPAQVDKDVENVSRDPEVQVRVGGVTVYSLNFEGNTPELRETSSAALCGILDIKWLNEEVEDKALFGLVDAEGYFQLLQLDQESKRPSSITKEQLSDSSLGLSLGWSPACSGGTSRVAASDSAGCLTVFDVDSKVNTISSWQAHGYEAWITAFHKTDKNILYSGGDDCRLKRWDLRDTTQPTFTSRRHQMGVCSIQSHPFKDYIFATGSYDEELIIWDDRQLKKPLSYAALGGGVWRIKWDPFQGDFILTATMYNGTHIIDCTDLGQTPLPVVAKYDDHNLAYGADWCRLSENGTQRPARTQNDDQCEDIEKDKAPDDDTYLISTCSFYDHALHLWEWQNS
ncbi:diphthine methyltransferase [Aplysia californica]|uniref:methylated diphthine methylhydrolase n=1 Tax=Aplysia californica TaxID=6500 RepID=A0ABM1VYC3_APLCA|nr:diphthine methyltransferase [Aplysia californica]XP_012941737.1 diphthine methyltransferase [Aplysia californica]XP_035827416.1 diphthine methyltransferase [Aplysia californica]